MSDTPITVPEFVKVRAHVAGLLKENSSTQISTRIRQAENLLMAGVIDVPAVLAHLTPTPVDTHQLSDETVTKKNANHEFSVEDEEPSDD